MKQFAIFLLALIAVTCVSCLSDDIVDPEWKDANSQFFLEQAALRDASGEHYYETVTAPWDPNAIVLMHWYNDRSLTEENLKPLLTSTVDVKYHLEFYDGTAADSSYLSTSPADSLFRTTLNSGVISGWPIAITQMHVGDSCRVVVPYDQGYGTGTYGNIKAYTTLVFDIKLVNIYKYEAKP